MKGTQTICTVYKFYFKYLNCRCVLYGSRSEFPTDVLIVKIGVDTKENELAKVWPAPETSHPLGCINSSAFLPSLHDLRKEVGVPAHRSCLDEFFRLLRNLGCKKGFELNLKFKLF